MEVRKSLEQKTLILGIEIRDLGVTLALFFGIMIFIGIVRMFIPISVWYNIAGIVAMGIYIGIVRYGLKNKHPSYIVSLLSFHFFQPKRIWMKKLSFIDKRNQRNGQHRQQYKNS
ncbi:hypothetical protein GCM10028808_62870 [Spirosoma migulaei]